LRQFAEDRLLSSLVSGASALQNKLKTVLFLLFLAFAILALSVPVGSKAETVKRMGVDIMVALDTSFKHGRLRMCSSRLEKPNTK
jgi:hypothetical protein